MSLIQMQKHLNLIRHAQSGQALQITRLALNRILEAKRGLISADLAALAYQVAIS